MEENNLRALLEDLCLKQNPCVVIYENDEGAYIHKSGLIKCLVTRGDREALVFEDEEELDLNSIFNVNGNPLNPPESMC